MLHLLTNQVLTGNSMIRGIEPDTGDFLKNFLEICVNCTMVHLRTGCITIIGITL